MTAKRTILITGSTDGIGKLVAIKFAKEGHDLIIHGRNLTKLNDLVLELKNLSNNDNVKGYVSDFSNLDEVQKMADKIVAEIPKIDILINNAGIFKTNEIKGDNGFDLRISINYFAPIILTNKLLPLLQKGIDARIINLSSAAQSPVSFDVLTGEKTVSQNESYAQSKLALTMWSFDLAQKLENINVIAVNPGSLLNTKMVKEAYGQHWSSADKGMNILYDLALSNEYTNVTGKYFDNDKGDPKGYFAEAHLDAYNQTKIDELLRFTNELIK